MKDISNESYAGVSGRHDNFGNAVHTTNGAGPHNIQIFILAADGTVLHCLPGYWNSSDLVYELSFASKLNDVWKDTKLSRTQKEEMFRNLHMRHVSEHPPQMAKRSRMQGFDQEYEARNRPTSSDTIRDRGTVVASIKSGMKPPPYAFKTTDQIMHERMARRPFLTYERFDVAAYADYGRPLYDKHEDAMDHRGVVNKEVARTLPRMGGRKGDAGGRTGPRAWGESESIESGQHVRSGQSGRSGHSGESGHSGQSNSRWGERQY